jgi:hypothetical protein
VHSRVIFPLLAAIALSASLPAHAGVVAEIPVEYRGGFLWLKVNAAGQRESLNFILDSVSGCGWIPVVIPRLNGPPALKTHVPPPARPST